MKMTGQFRIALLPDADPRAFVAHMHSTVFEDPGVLQSTRVTRGLDHQLLEGPMRQYVWQVTVDLMTSNAVYDMAANAARVQESVKQFGVLVGVESFTNVEHSLASQPV